MKRSRINPRNEARRAEAYARNFSGGIDHDAWIRLQPCVMCKIVDNRLSNAEAAHVKARGMGGWNSSWTQLVPLCRLHHREQEARGVATIIRVYQVDLRREAQNMVSAHLRELGAI